jgi:cytochrome b pre-mRNA-processing protein 3
MINCLFPRLTRLPRRGQALFDALVFEARQPHWFVEGAVPDSLDGRFALLSTVFALAIVRLERGSSEGQEASAALTERFIETMDAEHRQMGINDPALGKKVRKLVGALARRVEQWREAGTSESSWDAAVQSSLYRTLAPAPHALRHADRKLKELWARLDAAPDEAVAAGRIK